MPPKDFDFDLFLSHAGEDLTWTEQLAKRLRGEGIRVWFDRWQLEAGDKLGPRIDDGIRRSRRMAVVWTKSYFRPDKQWTQAETWSRQQADVLGRQRLLLPILREDCEIPALLADLLHIDFRSDARFEEALIELIRAIGVSELTRTASPPASAPTPVPANAPTFQPLDILGSHLVPLLIFLGFTLALGGFFGHSLIEKEHPYLGFISAALCLFGAFGILAYYLVLRMRGVAFSSQELALQRNIPQLLADHARSAAI
jgi:TIR domain